MAADTVRSALGLCRVSREVLLQAGVQNKKTSPGGLFQITGEGPEPVFNESEVVRQLVLLSLVVLGQLLQLQGV